LGPDQGLRNTSLSFILWQLRVPPWHNPLAPIRIDALSAKTWETYCHLPAPVFLSLAVIKWAGPVTEAIDGTSMDVDFVRVYARETP